ncbi:hypothetical protein JCM11251_002171 [Rhodosporidiobolus azoricus]
MSHATEAPTAKADDPRNAVAIYGSPVAQSIWADLMMHILPRIGLPHHAAQAVEVPTLEAEEENGWEKAERLPTYLGACITMPLKLQALRKIDSLDPAGEACGCINATYLRPSSFAPASTSKTPSLVAASLTQIGTNTDAPALTNVLLSMLLDRPSPFSAATPTTFAPGTAAAFAIGGGGAVRAAIHSFSSDFRCEPIFLLNRDEEEMHAVVEHFRARGVGVIPLSTVEEAEEQVKRLEDKRGRVVMGVGAIPCYEPQTDEEKRVYEVANWLFGRGYEKPVEQEKAEGYLALPEKRLFIDMAYKPRWTILRKMAEDNGWQTRCGTEVALENTYEQVKLWTGIDVPQDVRESAGKLLDDE